jgi:ATP synthase protein I
MTGAAAGQGGAKGQSPQIPRPRASDGWAAISYLLSGMALYGGLGWLIGQWTHIAFLLPVGMIAGLGFGVALVILRFRPH